MIFLVFCFTILNYVVNAINLYQFNLTNLNQNETSINLLVNSTVSSIQRDFRFTISSLNASYYNNTTFRNKRQQTTACYSNPCNSGTCYDLQVNILPQGGFYCVCPNGYTGIQCEKEINECLSSPCKNNGKCLDLIDSFFCQCPKGYSGVTCDNKMQSQICPPNACGDGECVLTTHPTFNYACKCRDGSYKFEPCSSAIQSKCASQPCAPYPCVETPNAPSGYVCQCGQNDYRTTKCDVNECRADSCSNGGSCIPYSPNEPWCSPSQVGKTCCQCKPGYNGLKCETEINECLSNPCHNGAECQDLLNSYKCRCKSGYNGLKCEKRAGCAVNPCKSGGTCILDSEGVEMCQCRDGFTGTFCEIDINECQSSPCQNGGTCIDLENSYACYCPDGYFRPTHCPVQSIFTSQITQPPTTTTSTTTTTTTTTPVTSTTTHLSPLTSGLCPDQSVCNNQGICIIIGQQFLCVCSEGYYGVMCELSFRPSVNKVIEPTKTTTTTTTTTTIVLTTPTFKKTNKIINECSPNPCLNRGTCITFTNGKFYKCFCKSGYSGTHCQVEPTVQITTESTTINKICDTNPCFNDGICTENGCICPSGYTGSFCETLVVGTSLACSEIQCLNGATCSENTLEDGSSNVYCLCRPGFTGSRCETEYFRCSQNGIFNDIYGCEQGRYLECIHYGQLQAGFPTGVLYRRDCPAGLRFNSVNGYCDYAENVSCYTV